MKIFEKFFIIEKMMKTRLRYTCTYERGEIKKSTIYNEYKKRT